MSLESTTCEDLKAFERRLTEVLASLQPACIRWRIILGICSITTGFSAFFWLRDPQTSFLPLFDSLLNHPLFFLSALALVMLFCYGIHKLVISPQIIISRTRTVLNEFNMSCNERGMLILKGFQKE
jgi:hypothetical protein